MLFVPDNKFAQQWSAYLQARFAIIKNDIHATFSANKQLIGFSAIHAALPSTAQALPTQDTEPITAFIPSKVHEHYRRQTLCVVLVLEVISCLVGCCAGCILSTTLLCVELHRLT